MKPEILDWLKYQNENQKLEEYWHWIGECRDLIQDLLTIKKEDRPSAKDTAVRLLRIRDSSAKLPVEKQQLWDYPMNSSQLMF